MHTLSEIEDAIKASWSLDTAEEDDGWTPENPSRGQCDVTCLVVHDIFGGEVLAADVFRDGERVEAHMWNRLPGGVELDLTRDQFKSGEVIGEPTARTRPASFEPEHPRHHRYEAYLVLARRVQERLAGSEPGCSLNQVREFERKRDDAETHQPGSHPNQVQGRVVRER